MHWDQRIANYVKRRSFPRASSWRRMAGSLAHGSWATIIGCRPDIMAVIRRDTCAASEPCSRISRKSLHLFSGKVDLAALPGDTVDINPRLKPTYVDDAQRLEGVPLGGYD